MQWFITSASDVSEHIKGLYDSKGLLILRLYHFQSKACKWLIKRKLDI